MIDKFISKIKQYPFQTGIIAGCILCLLISLVAGIFQDHGNTLSGNNALIQEDYLRMAIKEFTGDNDAQLAAWRYKFLGSKADEVLERMCADSSITAKELTSFADAIEKRGVVDGLLGNQDQEGSPTNPKRGISVFGKIILLLVGIGIIAAGGLFLYSKYGKKIEKPNWSGKINDLFTHKKPVKMVYPDESWEETPMDEVSEDDSMFDLDKMFSKSGSEFVNKKAVYEPIQETPAAATQSTRSDSSTFQDLELHDSLDLKPISNFDDEEEEEPDDSFYRGAAGSPSPLTPQCQAETVSTVAAADESAPDQEYEEGRIDDLFPEEDAPVLIEDATDEESYDQPPSTPDTDEAAVIEPEADDVQAEENILDSLIEEKRGYAIKGGEALSGMTPNEIDHPLHAAQSSYTNKVPEWKEAPLAFNQAKDTPTGDNNGLLLHYQSRYTIGNDMYDEVFSIEQGENDFRGECGIGIGETLNNTEPKAVTAFEVWLFDRDDIHTATQYLLSDFASGNDGISSRLKAHGHCDTIHKGSVYTLETLSLNMELKVLDVEYGNETEEQRAYFRNVLFDVCVREKDKNAG